MDQSVLSIYQVSKCCELLTLCDSLDVAKFRLQLVKSYSDGERIRTSYMTFKILNATVIALGKTERAVITNCLAPPLQERIQKLSVRGVTEFWGRSLKRGPEQSPWWEFRDEVPRKLNPCIL